MSEHISSTNIDNLTTITLSNNNIRNGDYQDYIITAGEQPIRANHWRIIPPLDWKSSDRQPLVSYLLRMPSLEEITANGTISNKDKNTYRDFMASIYNIIKDEFGCHTCGDRAQKYALYIDKNGPIFCREECQRNTSQTKARNKIMALWDFCIKKKFHLQVEPQFNSHKYLLNYEKKTGTEPEKNADWNHYYYKLNNITHSDMSDSIIYKLRGACVRYVPLMYNLMSKFRNRAGLLHGVNILYSIVSTARYASEYKDCVKWFRNGLLRFTTELNFGQLSVRDKYKVIAQYILDAPLEKSENGPYMSYYHSFSNSCVNWLENAHDEQSMRKMIEDHCSPENFKQRTAEITTGRAKNKLGVFTNTMCTTYELEQMGALIVPNQCPSMDLYGAIPIKRNKNSYICQKSSLCADHSLPYTSLTMNQLYDGVADGDIWKVEVDVNRNPTATYIVNTTLSADKIIYKHLWNYEHHPGSFQYSRWANLPAIYNGRQSSARIQNESIPIIVTHLYHWKVRRFNQTIFILPQAYKTLRNMPVANPCLYEFLTDEYQCDCGTVFQKYGLNNKLVIPPWTYGMNLAMGIGTSQKQIGSSSELNSIIWVRVNDQSNWIDIHNMGGL